MSKTFAVYVITKHGLEIAIDLQKSIPEAVLYVSKRYIDQAPEGSRLLTTPMGPTFKETWNEFDCHIHIISVGAVVRMIKDLLVNKKVDPAVVCIDDAARFAICLLSGHVGRGNAFTDRIAKAIDATPVITTASDAKGTLTVDILGRDLGWILDDPDRNVTKGCAEVVNENKTCFIQQTGESNFWPLDKPLPPGVEYKTSFDEVNPVDYEMLLIASDLDFKESYPEHWQNSVIYRPKSLVLGLGCDRDCPAGSCRKGHFKVSCRRRPLSQVRKAIVSIDKKADETAFIDLSEKYSWPFETYPEELDVVEGVENPSKLLRNMSELVLLQKLPALLNWSIKITNA